MLLLLSLCHYCCYHYVVILLNSLHGSRVTDVSNVVCVSVYFTGLQHVG